MNSRLTEQLHQLGLDLQKVYSRFKVLEQKSADPSGSSERLDGNVKVSVCFTLK
jgi:hypothetical protein